METGFHCSSCGEFHEGLPLDYGAKFPDYYFEIPVEERDARIKVNEDYCIVDDEFFFIRGCIEIRILETDDFFVWGRMVFFERKKFQSCNGIVRRERCRKRIAFFGWLNTSLPHSIYPETLNLKTNVYLKNNNLRPFVHLQPTNHPLAVEQENGITTKRVQEIAEYIMHDE